MELFDVIRVIGLCGTKDALFFTGSIILALEYLHHNNIIYRDLKPENIMIDQSGRLILIDLGTGKKLVKKPLKTFTIIGTPHYMAPEVLKNKGYSFLADLWSLGVCLYEFMCGDLPFGEDLDDPYDIY
jgi:cGMP-dependent protein kinase